MNYGNITNFYAGCITPHHTLFQLLSSLGEPLICESYGAGELPKG